MTVEKLIFAQNIISMRNKRIAVNEITKRHPRHLVCQTDRQYALLAEELCAYLAVPLSDRDPQEAQEICVSLALYFEDIHSGTHQWETFLSLYKKMFGRYLPFFDTTDEQSETAKVNNLRLVLWLIMNGEQQEMILNPCNIGIEDVAERLLDNWEIIKKRIEPNTELADYLFAEETQTDPMEIKNILVWLEGKSFLGFGYRNKWGKEDEYKFGHYYKNATKDQLRYATECYSAFNHRAWPLSLPTQRLYAEMIRIEMEDPEDEFAAAIEQIQSMEFGIYRVLRLEKERLWIRDYDGQERPVDTNSFSTPIKQGYLHKQTYILGSFFSFQGVWHSNGIATFLDIPEDEYNSYREQLFSSEEHKGGFDEFIDQFGGKRLFFFADFDAASAWVNGELGLKGMDRFPDMPIRDDVPLMLFFEHDGQLTISAKAECVKHPDNPFYDQEYAEDCGLNLLALDRSISPGLLLYLIENGLLPDLYLNDTRGYAYGHKLLQENMEFVARCYRRDIPTDKAVQVSANLPAIDLDDPVGHKQVFEVFVYMLRKKKKLYSSMHKEWRIVRCDKETIVVRDVNRKKDFSFAMEDLYAAYMDLDIPKFTIANVAPYVGKANAPAAAVVLYSTFGRGRVLNAMQEMVDLLKGKLSF